MNLLKMILKEKPNEAKCMGLFLSKLKENPQTKEFVISEEEVNSYDNMDELLNTMKKQGYIEWSKDEGYKIILQESFYNTFATVLKML